MIRSVDRSGELLDPRAIHIYTDGSCYGIRAANLVVRLSFTIQSILTAPMNRLLTSDAPRAALIGWSYCRVSKPFAGY